MEYVEGAVNYASQFYSYIDRSIVDQSLRVAERVSQAMMRPTAMLLVLYVTLYGIAMLRGTIENISGDLLGRMFRVFLAVGVALSVGSNASLIASFIFRFPLELAALLTGSTESPTSAIDLLLTSTDKTARAFIEKGKFFDGPFFAAVMWVCGAIVYFIATTVGAYALVMTIVAKIATGMLIAIAPIFIIALLFDSTKRFFESWVSQVISFMLQYALTMFAISLMFDYMSGVLDHAGANATNGLSVLQPVLLIGVAGLMVMIQVGGLASALASGMQMGSAGVIAAAMRVSSGRGGGSGGGTPAQASAKNSVSKG